MTRHTYPFLHLCPTSGLPLSLNFCPLVNAFQFMTCQLLFTIQSSHCKHYPTTRLAIPQYTSLSNISGQFSFYHSSISI
ncbi:MAG: hypothetical protein BYD32DRAFT_407750 [Podila humilis]|nr:MAG: hypothetical protein BYD32DRAFT_407750 [Podila humilis]